MLDDGLFDSGAITMQSKQKLHVYQSKRLHEMLPYSVDNGLTNRPTTKTVNIGLLSHTLILVLI